MSAKDDTVDLYDLRKAGHGIAKIADDGLAQGSSPRISFDKVHAHCHNILTSLAKAGHVASHELLNPSAGRKPQGGAPNPAGLDGMLASSGLSGSPIPESVGDNKAPLSREAAQAVGKIGI